MQFQQKLGPQRLFDINKLRYECINNHQHISTCYTTTIQQTGHPCLSWPMVFTGDPSNVQGRFGRLCPMASAAAGECQGHGQRWMWGADVPIHHLRARVQVEPVLNEGVKCMQMYGKFEDFPLILVQCLGWSYYNYYNDPPVSWITVSFDRWGNSKFRLPMFNLVSRKCH